MTTEVILGKSFAGISAGDADIDRDEPLKALDYLQSIYRDPLQPASVRMRAVTVAVQYECPKLQATAILRDENAFAVQLERALARSAKVIELKANGEG